VTREPLVATTPFHAQLPLAMQDVVFVLDHVIVDLAPEDVWARPSGFYLKSTLRGSTKHPPATNKIKDLRKRFRQAQAVV
jgi:hypothetical protein